MLREAKTGVSCSIPVEHTHRNTVPRMIWNGFFGKGWFPLIHLLIPTQENWGFSIRFKYREKFDGLGLVF